jgi:hypothetical protein
MIGVLGGLILRSETSLMSRLVCPPSGLLISIWAQLSYKTFSGVAEQAEYSSIRYYPHTPGYASRPSYSRFDPVEHNTIVCKY